jgi:ribosomal protein S17E
MEDPDAFWNLFEANLQIYGASVSEIEQKARIVSNICKTIREMGAQVDEEETWDFLYNFEKKYQRLPMDDEYTPIAMDFIKLNDEKSVVKEEEAFVEQQPQQVIQEISMPTEEQPIEEGGITVTPTDAIKEMVKDISTIDPETQTFYLKMIDTLALEDQKRLVAKIKAIEGDLNKIPYLLDNERIKIRRDVMEMTTEKRRERLLKIIKDRQRNEAQYMARYVEQQLKLDLTKLPFLTKENISDIMSVILTMSYDEKKDIVSTITMIEEKFNEMERQGIHLSAYDKNNYRNELIRMNPKDRMDQLEKIVEEHRGNHVKEILFAEIPQLEFENNKDLIKQLMWLSDSELRDRITKIKNDMVDQNKEKTQEFAKSSSATVCKKCGWPMSAFSKKCPRCGWTPDEWFKV